MQVLFNEAKKKRFGEVQHEQERKPCSSEDKKTFHEISEVPSQLKIELF